MTHDLRDLVAFWFERTPREAWFKVDPAFDDSLRQRFEPLIEPTASLPPPLAPLDPDEALGRILVLDQLPRNLYRGTARAFAYDAQARTIARHVLIHGLDSAMSHDQRAFAMLPFEHSEELADLDLCLRLATKLGGTYLEYALAHHRIIARFGRYPHRNAALGRRSTEEELAFLAGPDSAF